jgi:putative heme-binding domain-containing protein
MFFVQLVHRCKLPRCFCALALLLFVSSELALAKPAEPRSVDGAAEPATAAAVYGEMVRSTPRLTAEEQRQGFHLPPGFEIRLFAAEPQIAKPINMAVDHRDRLWVTHTTAYPKPAPGGSSKTDAVKILADTTGDGLADRATTFADHLNIPIGILPFGDGCICFSIPNLLYLQDTTGDGICDRRDVLLGPFDTMRDTHGMVNSLRDGGDGWIYACHGFNNRSTVSGTDGHEVYLESGNTFRFRPDGSRVELVTQGQVNPFGMTRDDFGYWYSADCHSKPITQLIRGACYPSFGRPHDGLGFMPPTVNHLHGSTAISGILYIPNDSRLEPLRGQLLSGNVMTSRLNRNQLVYQGATARGLELSDFLTSDDPWFRPVDLQMDRQGNIYVADFYNKIIGHYEVPLDHPDRDRTSGRIWQIRYVGATTGDSDERPIADLVSPPSVPADPQIIAQQIIDGDVHQRIDAIRRAAELPSWPNEVRQAILAGLSADNAHVIRMAAEAIGLTDGDEREIMRLAEQLATIGNDDPVLRQTFRIAIANRLRRSPADATIWNALITDATSQRIDEQLASILPAVQQESVVIPILDYLNKHPDALLRRQLIGHAVTLASSTTLDAVIAVARTAAGDSLNEQHAMLQSLYAAQRRSASASSISEPLQQWTLEVAQRSLERFTTSTGDAWFFVGWTTTDGEPWPQQKRKSDSGGEVTLRSSFPRGESYVGSLISDPFPAPKQLRFRLAGHVGRPNDTAHANSYVRLLSATDGSMIRQAAVPRSDVASLVSWDLADVQGQSVRLECHDGDSAAAYAWIAIGEFEPQWLNEDAMIDDLRMSLHWLRELRIDSLVQTLQQMLAADRYSTSIRLEIALAIAEAQRQRQWEAVLAGFKLDPRLIVVADQALARYLAAASTDDGASEKLLDETYQLLTSHLSAQEQLAFARQWVQRGASADGLIRLCELGWLSPSVLADENLASILQQQLNADRQQRMQKLVAALPASDGLDQLRQDQLLAEIVQLQPNRDAGGELFKRHCAACHQLRGNGSVVGPQLDGAISRSDLRLLEDILLPDRNVDEAFRTTSLLLDDGRVVVGMIQAENESTLTLVDPSGKVLTVEADSVQTRIEAGRSLMPSNFAELLSAAELANLLAFLRER